MDWLALSPPSPSKTTTIDVTEMRKTVFARTAAYSFDTATQLKVATGKACSFFVVRS
jgi:hypothetical protein